MRGGPTAPGHGPSAWRCRADHQVSARAIAGRPYRLAPSPMTCGRPQVAPTAARSSLADGAANFRPGFSGAGEGVRACSADSIATKILRLRA